MRGDRIQHVAGGVWLAAILVLAHPASVRGTPLCPVNAYHVAISAPETCCQYWNECGDCCWTEAHWCGDGSIIDAKPVYDWCPTKGDDSWFYCPAGVGQQDSCDPMQDRNEDGCIGEGCTIGTGRCTCTASCAVPACHPVALASCRIHYQDRPEVCGNGTDNNCNGVPSGKCKKPPDPCNSGATAGDDPLLLSSQSAVTEPFADFSVDTGLLNLTLTRTYTSADWSYFDGPAGIFGRGWHHEWEGWLSCSNSVCTVTRGIDRGYQFQRANPSTDTSLDGTETWQLYSAFTGGGIDGDNHNYLVRRPSGEWIMFNSDGSEWHFATVCDTCASSSADPSFCQDAGLGGKARLVKVVDPKGSAVTLTYDRSGGVLLGLADDLGHSLQVLSTSACSDGHASSLVYDGITVATYGYTGPDLVQATDADGHVLRGYGYYAGYGGRLATVRNEAGDAIASFAYDSSSRAVGVIDKRSSVQVVYDPSGGTQVTEFYGNTSSTSVRALDQDGNVTFVSGDSSCGPPRTLNWTKRRLTCTSDSLNHVVWQEFDDGGRLIFRAESSSSQGCSADPYALDPAVSRQESRNYGLQRSITKTFAYLPLGPVTSIMRTGIPPWMVASTSYDYDPAPNSIDPPGYACQQSPMPAGSALCRRTEYGATSNAAGGFSVLPERHVTFYSYDARGRLVRALGPINVDYPSPSDITPVEERTYWADDESLARRGRLKELKRYPSLTAMPLVTAYDYDAFGVFQITEPNGGVTTTVKDGRGRPIAVLAPDGGLTRTRYHDGVDPRLQLLPGGNALRSNYDGLGRLAAAEYLSGDPEAPGTTSALGWGEYYTYDSAGNRVHTERRDASGAVTWQQDRSYDVQHRVVSDTNPEAPSAARTWNYDPSGFLTAVTDEERRVTAFTPDLLNRTWKISRSGLDLQGQPTSLDIAQYQFQPNSDTISAVTDGGGESTSYSHDDFGRVLTVNSSNFRGGQVKFRYDARGNVLQRNDDYVSITYTYDGLDRVLTLNAIRSVDGSSIRYEYHYDEPPYAGHLTSVVEPDRIFRYTYDSADRIQSESVQENTVSAPLVTRYAYDSDGAIASLTYPSGLQVQYLRDPASRRIVQVKNPADGTHYADQVARAPEGPVTALAFGNGLALSQTFNRRYEPQSIVSGPLSLAYRIGPAGDVATLTDAAETRSFAYDFLGRLASVMYDFGDNTPIQGAVEDALGSFSYLTASRVAAMQTPQGSLRFAYSYDHGSNLSGIGEYDSAGQAIVNAICLLHDPLGHLVLVGTTSSVVPDGTACTTSSDVTQVLAEFKYDAQGRRIARNLMSTNQSTYFISNSSGQLLSELALANGQWTPVRDYVWLDGNPLAQVEHEGAAGTTQGYVYYYHLDHLGVPRSLTNQAGLTVWSAISQPYGSITESTTTDPLSGKTVVTNLRLPGQYDERLFQQVGINMPGPFYNWNRWYLPSLGRYMEPDPIAQRGKFNSDYSPDWYSYALGNPIRYIDIRGLDVYVCQQRADVTGNWLDLPHKWVKTDAGEGGLGRCGAGVPGGGGSPDLPGVPVCNNDHDGRSRAPDAVCTKVDSVDEKCVNSRILQCSAQGRWGPGNTCWSYVDRILDECHKQCK